VGKRRSYLMTTALVIAMLSLAFLVKDSQAGFAFQTVPTEAPTQSLPSPANPTPTTPPLPTTGSLTATPVNATTQLPPLAATSTQPASTLTTSTATSLPENTTPASLPSPTVMSPDQGSKNSPDQPKPGTVSASESKIKSIYLLICGLGLVSAILIIVILVVRKISKDPKPPTSGQPG